MKMIKIFLGCFLIIMGSTLQAHTAYAKSNLEYPVVVDFLDSSSNSRETLSLAAASAEHPTSDERDMGGWCTVKVRIAIKKPNGGYTNSIEILTLPAGFFSWGGAADACNSFDVIIDKKIDKLTAEGVVNISVDSKKTAEQTGSYVLADLLKQTSQASIIANNTNAQIKLFNAPSLGSGAKDGVPINPGATIPFYLNEGSTGEELVIKGNGAGTVSFGNDYANHKTTLIGSTNISQFAVIDGNGKATNKKPTQGQLVIDPLERLDVTTPAGDWEIKLKVAEEIQ